MSGTDNKEEQTCDICKISYVTEKELKDHEWSLMHHIKIEQKKKGSIHKCSLCFTTCPNLIDYGKHLNGDKHKQAIEESRVQIETLDPQEIHSRLHAGEKEEEPVQEPIRQESTYSRETRSHQRSYSQPIYRGQYFGGRRPYQGKHRQFYGDYSYQDSFENPHWHRGGMRQMFPYQWGQPWELTSPDPWEHPNQTPEGMNFQEKGQKVNRHFNDHYSESGVRYERQEFIQPERDISEQEVDKRRIESDRNKNESDETSGYTSQPCTSQESMMTKRRKRSSDTTYVDPPTGGRTTKNSKGRSLDPPVFEADSTTDIEMLSKTDVEVDRKLDSKKKLANKVKKKKAVSSKSSPRSDEGDTVLERAEKLCKELRDKREKAKREVQKEKKIEKNAEINRQLAKYAEINKKYVKGVLDDTVEIDSPVKKSSSPSMKTEISSTTPTKILVNSPSKSPAGSSTKTKSKMSVSKPKNALQTVTKTADTYDNTQGNSQEEAVNVHSPKVKAKESLKARSGKIKVRSPGKSASRDIDEIRREIEEEVQQSQKDHLKMMEMERTEVQQSKPDRSEMDSSDKVDHLIEFERRKSAVESNEQISIKHDKFLDRKRTISDDSADEVSKSRLGIESTSRDSLLKMVNSPRSRKERQQLAEVLRTYAKSQNRLSLPRFNIHMSDLYDNLEHCEDFRLEELSPDVQLQIAELIENDIKPDLNELEKTLLSDIKVEPNEEPSTPGLSLSASVDKLELLDRSLNQRQKESSNLSDIESMNHLNKIRSEIIPSEKIKKEPLSEIHSSIISYPQSPEYSQEEREFIKKFCTPSSPIRHSNSPVKETSRLDTFQPESSVNRTHVPLVSEKQGTSSTLNVSPSNSRQIDGENKLITKADSPKPLRSRSNSLSSLSSPKMNFGSNLMSNTERLQKKIDKDMISYPSYKVEVTDRETIKQNYCPTQPTGFLSEHRTDEHFKSGTQSKDVLQQQLYSSDQRNPDYNTNYDTETGDTKIVASEQTLAPVWFSSVVSPQRLSETEPNHSSIPSFTGGHSSSRFSDNEQLVLKPSDLLSVSGGMIPHSEKQTQSQSVNMIQTEEKILVAPPVSLWYGGEPLSTGGTSNTNVTTWSTSSGYLTQPQVMSSSSEMSVSNVSRDIRMRRPSETSTAESLVDTVYDISIKEEDIRQELQDVDQNITRLQKLIEKSTAELNSYKDRKETLKKEEENLRSRRINVLQEAKDKQRRPDSRHESDMSDRPTPPLSANEEPGIGSGGRHLYPFCTEETVQGSRLRMENVLRPSIDTRSDSTGRIGKPFPITPHAGHKNGPEPLFEPYILRGLQTLNTIQQLPEQNQINASPNRSSQSITPPEYMKPMTVHGSNVAPGIVMPPPGPSLHSMIPVRVASELSPHQGHHQRMDQSKDVSNIKLSDILYQGVSVSSTSDVSSGSQLSPAFHSHLESSDQKKSASPINKQTLSDQQSDIQTTIYDSKSSIIETESDNIHVDNVIDNQISYKQSEDIVMVSDVQKNDDIIVIHDSPKRSFRDQKSHKTWVEAEKPESESQPVRMNSPERDIEGQSHFSTQSPIALKHRKIDEDVTRKLQPPLQPTLTKDGKQSDKEQMVFDKDDKNTIQDLESYGFVTLSNLIGSESKKSPQATSINSPHKGETKLAKTEEVELKAFVKESDQTSFSELHKSEKNKQEEKFVQNEADKMLWTEKLQKSSENDVRDSDRDRTDVVKQIYDNRDRVNVQYMGSLSHGMDQSELFKHLKTGKSKDDRMSFLLVDGDQNKDMYDKLQLLFTKPPSGSVRGCKGEPQIDLDNPSDSGIKDVDSNFESVGSNGSLGEKIRQYCKHNKSDNTESLINLSDGEQKEIMECSAITPGTAHIEEKRSSSPYRKRLKTKKERDKASLRKQKEGCILDSSSDYNSPDEDITVKHVTNYKTGQKSTHSDVEIISDGKEEFKQYDLTSEDTKPYDMRSEVIPHRLLEDVQLETESDDSRALFKDKFSERFKLKPEFLSSLKAAVNSSLSKRESKSDPDNKVQCHGPEEQVSGIQVVEQEVYVSFLGKSVRKFCIKTGKLLHIFDCSPHHVSCLYVLKTKDTLRLYTGGSSQHLINFNASTGQLLRSENLEEKLQCFHHNWGKLFIGTYTGSILVWSTKTDRNIDAYVCSDRPISCISSATEGAQKVILVAAYDSTVFVLSATSGLLIRILEGHTKTVFSLQVDGSIVFSGSGDKTVIEHNLQTGDMIWTYTQAAGIITSVCVYDDLLFCASFDKYIRCYTREDHKLKALYYGADKGLVTQMIVSDDKIVTGNRNGKVEIIPIGRDKETSCQFEGCCHVFGIKHHLLHHLISDHVTPNTKMFRCLWKGCKDWLSTKEGLQDAENHMKQHLFPEL